LVFRPSVLEIGIGLAGTFRSASVPPGTSSFEFIRFKQLIEKVLGRETDLISCGGLELKVDDDIRRDVVLL
jgi:predicted nucleotidyltransferase